MISIIFKAITHGRSEYIPAIQLSEGILRTPLGLTFSREELEKEKEYIQIAGLRSDEVIAAAALVSEGESLKMRRVVVRNDLQKQGVVSAMLYFCEEYALKNKFKEIYCHARDVAIPFYIKNHYIPEENYFDEDTLVHLKLRKILVPHKR